MTTSGTQFYNNPNKGDSFSNPSVQQTNNVSSNNKPQVNNNPSQIQADSYQSQPQFQPQAQQLQQQQQSSKQSTQHQQPSQQTQPQNPNKQMQVSQQQQQQPVPQPGAGDGKTRNISPNKSFAGSSLDRPLFDAQAELHGGKSEEEVLNKLKVENAKLRKELKCISDDLTVLLEKKKTKKVDKPTQHVKDIVSNVGISEQGLRSELDNANKQLERLQKELTTMKGKYDSEATYSKYQELEESLHSKESRVDQLQGQKKVLEKKIRENEKTLDSLLNEVESNSKVNNLAEEARMLRERIKEVERKKENNEKQAQNRKAYIAKITAEMAELKQEFNRVQQITKFEAPKDNKPVGGQSKSGEKVFITPKNGSLSAVGRKTLSLELNEENYEKLKKEWKILMKARDGKSKRNQQDVNALNDGLADLEKAIEDKKQKYAEKIKEISILNSKLKDLGRIVRHQAVAPLQQKEFDTAVSKDTSSDAIRTDLRSSLIKREAYNASRIRNNSKLNKNPTSPKKLQPNHMLVEYAKNHFQSKGYRKDERGKVLHEDEGINFNDKDVVGKQRVKMIALDIWHDDHKITGIQAVYENDKGDVVEGGPHVVNPDQSKMVTFETLEEDHVKEISGFTDKNETSIQCLILRTFRGETMKVGQPSKDSKLFKFDINELEYPAIIYGSIKEGANGDGRLARLGVFITSETAEERAESHARREERKRIEEEEKKQKEEAERREKEAASKKSLNDVKSQGSLNNGSRGGSDSKDMSKDMIKNPSKGQGVFDGKRDSRDDDGEEEQEEQGEQEDQAEIGGYEDGHDGALSKGNSEENHRYEKTESSSPARN